MKTVGIDVGVVVGRLAGLANGISEAASRFVTTAISSSWCTGGRA
jgi:hypothetical protein